MSLLNLSLEYQAEPWYFDEDEKEWSRHYAFRYFCLGFSEWRRPQIRRFRYDGLPRCTVYLGWFWASWGKDHDFEHRP